MAVTPTTSNNTLALELDGAMAGLLRSATLPALGFAEGAAPTVGRFEAEFQPAMSPGLLPFALSLGQPGGPASRGALVQADFNRKPMRRLDWTGAQVSMVAFSPLDARDSRQSFSVLLQWDVQTLKTTAEPGKQAMPSPGRAKAWVTSNFSVDGLPFSGRGVTRVELPTVTLLPQSGGVSREPARGMGAVCSNWQLEVSGPSLLEATAWVLALRDKGGVTAADRFDLQIQLLDNTMKTALGVVTLKGCNLLRYQDAPLGASNASGMPSATLTLSAQSLDLKASGR